MDKLCSISEIDSILSIKIFNLVDDDGCGFEIFNLVDDDGCGFVDKR